MSISQVGRTPYAATRIPIRTQRASVLFAVLGLVGVPGCAPRGIGRAEGTACTATRSVQPTARTIDVRPSLESETRPFVLKPEWQGPCARADSIDVNLGHTPASFIRAAKCQVSGQEPSAEELQRWSGKLVYGDATRRIDVVRAICRQSSRNCQLTYSDPWREQVELRGAPAKNTGREIGAVLMFFFSCPAAVNCSMDWANTHAPGMAEKSGLLAFGDAPSAYYAPSEPGFWRRELEDAKYAGLSFLMPNAYGPDIEVGRLAPLEKALESLQDPINIALFDDTWAWGEPWFGDFWKERPDLRDADQAAKTLYEAKWKVFFSQIDPKYWFRVKGKPFIYFYNSGKLSHRDQAAPVLAKMKQMFRADFGEEPFVAVDLGYFEDPTMDTVADQKFQWFTFGLPSRRSRSTMNGVTLDHAMVKWDALVASPSPVPRPFCYAPNDRQGAGRAARRDPPGAAHTVRVRIYG